LIIKSVVAQRVAVRCIVWLGDVTVLVLAVWVLKHLSAFAMKPIACG